MAEVSIHPQAIVGKNAELGAGVRVGAFSIIEDGAVVGDNTVVGEHVIVRAGTSMGKENRVFPFATLGEDPPDLKYRGEESRLVIGDGNILREYVNFHRGTGAGGGTTRIGNHNLIMNGVHIAHDCVVGDHAIFANHTSLAGHVHVGSHANLGGFTLVYQYLRLGQYVHTGAGTLLLNSVPAFFVVSGNPARPRGVNQIGLQRAGVSAQEIALLKKAYRILRRRDLLLEDILPELAKLCVGECDLLRALIDHLKEIGSLPKGTILGQN